MKLFDTISKSPLLDHPFAAELRTNKKLQIAVGILVIALVFRLIAVPFMNWHRDLERQVDLAAESLDQVAQLGWEYKTLKEAGTGFKSTGGTQQLFAKLDGIARKLKISSNVDFMRPAVNEREGMPDEEEVYIRFKNMLQKDFIHFLFEAEMRIGVVNVKQLRIKRTKNKRFDVDLVLTRLIGD